MNQQLSVILLIPMSEVTPLPPQLSGPDPPTQLGLAVSKKRPLLAAFVSAILPGTGQMVLGEWPKAMVLVALFAALIVGFWPLRMMRYYVGYIPLILSALSLYFYSTCSTLLSRGSSLRARPSRWWILLTTPVCLLAVVVFAAIMFQVSGFRSFAIPSISMEPTLHRGEIFMVDTKSRTPRPGGVIAFSRNGTIFVKRVIAIGGDTIQGKGGSIFINGVKQNEPYTQHTGTPPQWMNDFGPTNISLGHLFVMGDNRDVSLDSRSPDVGLIDSGSIVGTPLYVVRSKSEGRAIR